MNATCLADILDPKRNNFTLLRLAAALAVVVSHSVFLQSGNFSDQIFSSVSVYNLGDHAVNVFFILSGLTIAASLSRSNGIILFLLARALRIFPGLVACTALLVVLGMLISECSWYQYISDTRVLKFALKTITLSTGAGDLPGVFASNPYPAVVNVSLWTLKYEVFCYLLLSLIAGLKLFNKKSVAVLLLISGLLAAGYLVYVFDGHANPMQHWARFWFNFSLGVGFFMLRQWIKLSPALGLGLAALTWIALGTGWEKIIAPIALGYIALFLAAVPLVKLRELSNRVDLSYGVYIFGWPVSQTLLMLKPEIGVSALTVLSVIVSIGMALFSWHFIEKPSLNARTYILDLTHGCTINLARRISSWRSRYAYTPSPSIVPKSVGGSRAVEKTSELL